MNIKAATHEFISILFGNKSQQSKIDDIDARLNAIEESNTIIANQLLQIENHVNILIMLNPHIRLAANQNTTLESDELEDEIAHSRPDRILN